MALKEVWSMELQAYEVSDWEREEVICMKYNMYLDRNRTHILNTVQRGRCKNRNGCRDWIYTD